MPSLLGKMGTFENIPELILFSQSAINTKQDGWSYPPVIDLFSLK